MNPSGVVQRVETWLQATWHIKAPFQWLEACVNWIQQENAGANLIQAQINKQVFEQWLLTDLRDLGHPVLPGGISQAAKVDVNGFYCLQIDSLVDVSQPAYSQIQKLRGKDATNENVTAVTQASQKPWEAKPNRLLMLQLTDGVQQLQGMEYQPIPVLHASLHPGTKILLQGEIICRLGVLLLKPGNVKVIGGEVEALVEEFTQERVLSRLLGEPENATVRPNNMDQELEDANDVIYNNAGPSDEELLASLEADDQLVMNNEVDYESGYGSRSEHSSVITLNSAPQSNRSYISGQSFGTRTPQTVPQISSEELVEFDDADFDDFPVEELDEVIFQQEKHAVSVSVEQHLNSSPEPSVANYCPPQNSTRPNDVASLVNLNSRSGTLNDSVEHTVPVKLQTNAKTIEMKLQEKSEDFHSNTTGILEIPNRETLSGECKSKPSSVIGLTNVANCPEKVTIRPVLKCEPFGNQPLEIATAYGSNRKDSSASSALKERGLSCSLSNINIDTNSLPFTYLSVLLAKKPATVTVVKVKAFIVTLLGNLSNSNGSWSIQAKISDGSEYLDVELANQILSSLIGYSVAETNVLKKDPVQRKNVMAGLQKCQQELVDLCCIMSIEYDPSSSKAVVLALQDITLENHNQLEKRVLNKRAV
ncbi:recQ-mediated genome instability protein 1-like [Polyodon spathula]|uniref:recQ-mediated genome instability protein 1-like n=1 Tax=Polyodon spathula TaxID=7913 RepID=UPI001B7E4CB6|nr:recQ-mediated genome instability protein 1-like [Polyodon spathula]